ncbi:MAG: two-component regulator propeller domain-containing protein, partial [Bacteroidota bacterium]
QKASYTVFRPGGNIDYPYSFGVKNMEQEENGRIWVLIKDRIFWLDPTTDGGYHIQQCSWEQLKPDWRYYQASDLTNRLPDGTVEVDQRFYSIFKSKAGNIWTITAGGFSRWQASQRQFIHYPLKVKLADYSILPLEGALGHHTFFDEKGRIWHIGIRTLVVYDTASHELVTRLHTKEKDTPKYFQSGFRSLMRDNNGNVWVGTNGKGLYKYTPHRKKFSGQKNARLYKTGSILSICQTNDGDIWIGTSDKRLIRIDATTEQQELIELDPQKAPFAFDHEFDHIFSMAEGPHGALWLGGRKGLYRLQTNHSGQWEQEYFEIYSIDGYYPSVMDIHFDRNGLLWLLTPFEFGTFDVNTGKFKGENYLEDPKDFKGFNPPCIYQQNDSIFWVGTGHGLYKYNAKAQQYTFLSNGSKDRDELSHQVVKCITADPQQSNQVLWIGTGGGGICRYDTKNRQFTTYKKQDGLPDDVVYGILSDEAGYLWLSTNQGLCRFDPKSGAVKTYKVENGLQDNEFNTGAYHKSSNGQLYFGGISGLNVFHPTAIQENEFQPPVIITDFNIANKSANFKKEHSPLLSDIAQTDVLRLHWHNNIFSLEFTALDYTEPNRNQFAYRMVNFKEEWQYIGTQRTATFTNLDPGEYTFQVKGTNYDGQWNERPTSLKIIILPPWWRSWWAYLIYLLAGASAIVALYLFQLNRRMEKVEADNLKKLDQLKTRFYTNITHEFRTPLTVIQGMSDQIAGY